MKKKSKKIKETSNLLQITKKLGKHQLLFLYENLSSSAKNLLCELMFNILYNKNCLCLSKYQTCKLKRILKPHQKDMEYIARRSNSENKKEKNNQKANRERCFNKHNFFSSTYSCKYCGK